MRVLLDECLPRGLKKHLPGHEITTVEEAGWSGEKNGALLRLAAGKFDVFVTVEDFAAAIRKAFPRAEIRAWFSRDETVRYRRLPP